MYACTETPECYVLFAGWLELLHSNPEDHRHVCAGRGRPSRSARGLPCTAWRGKLPYPMPLCSPSAPDPSPEVALTSYPPAAPAQILVPPSSPGMRQRSAAAVVLWAGLPLLGTGSIPSVGEEGWGGKAELYGLHRLCPDKGGWGWSWLERWQVAQPWNNPLMMSHHYKWVRGQDQGAHARARTSAAQQQLWPQLALPLTAGARSALARWSPRPDQYIPHDLCNICRPHGLVAREAGHLCGRSAGDSTRRTPPVMIHYSFPLPSSSLPV